ncbi:MAG: FMN-binding protein [Oscillospiraceae bacterium]|jgi:major membrane immunogen (membrane-anchored lipoprotein)|nr:FMN-binding protein [Oscillospiraceae bacterium]
MKFLRLTAVIASAVLLLAGCAGQDGGMRDGYYTAEAAAFDDEGWKDFITLYVADGKIVTAEFNARNSSGFVRSWDPDYQRATRAETGLNPSEYLRTYTGELLNLQNPAKVLVVAGAERPHETFQLLTEAAIVHAKAGDKTTAFVELP